MTRPKLLMAVLFGAAVGCASVVRSDDGGSVPDAGLVETHFSVTQIYQQNVHGGLSTHDRAGRLAGSYDVELSADLERLAGFESASVYVHAEGSWPKIGGINDEAVGSFFGVNGDARPRRAVDVTELWYEQRFFADALALRAGKIDLTGGFEHRGCPVSFDCSTYANDENTQFLNNALVNNPTIPFPDYGLAVAVNYSLAGPWYVSAAIADAEADFRETGFSTTFDGDCDFFYIFEGGLAPKLSSNKGGLQGVYRFGLWYDTSDKADFSTGGIRDDDRGFYLSFDQLVLKENDRPDDGQGLAVFGRYGRADRKVNEVAHFWSAGIQYEGLLSGRDSDVIAFGFGQGFFSDRAADFTEDYESVCEVYYRAYLRPWLVLTPDVQYVVNPGGAGAADALVAGVRLQVSF